MTTWILPININNENDVISWFNEEGSIYYRITKSCKNLTVGDVIYFFETFTYKSIVIKGMVRETKLHWGDFKNESRFDVISLSKTDRISSEFVKVDLICFINNRNINRNFLSEIGIKSFSYTQKNNWDVKKLEKTINSFETIKGKKMFEVFGENAPNIYYLPKIVKFTGVNKKEYFTTRAKYSLSDDKPYPHICNKNKSLVSCSEQKRIVEAKLKSLGIQTCKYSKFKKTYLKINIHRMIKMLEKAIQSTSANLNRHITKNDFLEFLSKDYHQSSYKYSFLISMLINIREDGTASIKKVVQTFSEFYVGRINLGLMPEKYETQIKQSIEYWSNFNKMKSLVFEPDLSFSSFNKRGFVFKNEEKDLIYFDKELWNSFEQKEITDILNDQINRRNDYFNSSSFKKHNPHSLESINEDIKEIEDNIDIPIADKEVYIKARVGQGKFRRELLELFKCKCAVTKLDLLDLLVASHIMPWRSANTCQKIDKNNGLLLSSNFDKLFDVGLISFTDDGYMLISSEVNQKQRKILQLEKYNKLIIPLNDKQKEYLKYHRDVLFMK